MKRADIEVNGEPLGDGDIVTYECRMGMAPIVKLNDAPLQYGDTVHVNGKLLYRQEEANHA